MDYFQSHQSTEHDPNSWQTRRDFSWDILRFIIEGNSPIDIQALTISDRSEAHRFLLSYGYDLNDPQDRGTLEDIFNESVRFIKTHFSRGHSARPSYLAIPSEIERLNDLRDLLIWASGPRNRDQQAWACAILRVMHTIHHIDNTLRVEFFYQIKQQILNRFKTNIVEKDGQVILGTGPLSVPLYGIFYKEEKTRDSLIFKLLHKPKNVAEKIHDRLGVKLVTHNRLDVVRALYYLYSRNIITFANLTPGRSRNTLIDLQIFEPVFKEMFRCFSIEDENAQREFLDKAIQRIQNISPEEDSKLTANRAEYNPSSSSDYQSLQFTVQQLVKLENPGFFKTRRMRVQLEKYHMGPDMEGLLQELEGPGAEKEVRLLFPLEVQIIDKDNYLQSIEGTASHEAYKQRQQDLACLRVLGGLFALHPEIDPRVKRSDNLSMPLP